LGKTPGDIETETRLARVLPRIYAAAAAADRWPDALAAVAGLLNAASGLIFSHQASPEQRGLWVSHNISAEAIQRYVSHYHAHDVWMQRGHALDIWVPGRVAIGADLLPRREFLASAFYREFLAPQDIHDICAGILHDGSEAGIPRINLAVYRPHALPPFDKADKALLAALLPHLAEAARISFRIADLEQREQMAGAAADLLLPALAMTDRNGNLVYANRALQRLLAERDGLSVEGGRLRAGGTRLQEKLDRLMAAAADPEAGLKLPRPSGKAPYWIIQVDIPMPRETPPDSRRPSRAYLIHDPAAPMEANLKDFAGMHGLTPAEMRLLAALLVDSTLPAAARQLGVSVNTLRSQLKSVLEKTGARRQVELVKMLAAWPRRGRREK
jgi:DNA-binding CsgD family transcriptional regulator